MKVIVMSGIPGSGKSTLARERFPGAVVFSADAYFMVDGEYRFDPARIGEAHNGCLRSFTETLQAADVEVLVVDNTNLSVAEIAPYAALAQAYGAELLVLTVRCDVARAWTRNVHGVSAERVTAMAAVLASRELPPWWPSEEA